MKKQIEQYFLLPLDKAVSKKTWLGCSLKGPKGIAIFSAVAEM
jgi:hypothetical protein